MLFPYTCLVFKKYKVINGKKYGPYLYENKRIGGRVVTVYHGLANSEIKDSSKNFLKYFVIITALILILAFGIFLIYNQFSPTGNVVLTVDSEYQQNENLTGRIKLLIDNGEIIPADSDLTLTLSDYTKTYKLRDVIENEIVTGEYYIPGTSISGNGEGFGSSSVLVDHPEVDFEIKIIKHSQNSQDDSSSEPVIADSNENQQNQEVSSEQVFETPDETDETSSALTGNVIDELATSEEIISGSVFKGEDFIYEGDFEDFEIVEGSVRSNDQELDESVLSISSENGKIVVSTDYEITREVSGEDKYLLIELSALGIPVKKGSFSVSLSYNGEEIVSAEKEINIESVNQGDSVESNVTNELTQIKAFDELRISANGSLELNLEDYFSKASEFEFTGNGLTALFNGSNVIISPNEGFKGAVKARFTAINGDERLDGNEFSILVSSGAVNIVTSREKIVVGQTVKWKKNVTLESGEDLTIDLPKSAEKISIVKSTETGEEEIEVNGVLTGNVIRSNNKENGIIRLLKKLISSVTGNAIFENKDEALQVKLDEGADNYVIEYETPAPESKFEDTSRGKNIVISAPDELGYTDVIASANIAEKYPAEKSDSIKLYWRDYGVSSAEIKSVDQVNEEEIVEEISSEENINSNNGLVTGNVVSIDSSQEQNSNELIQTGTNYILREVPFDAYDLDFDGMIDYIEWVVPHLSNQTFEIIYIDKAEHLDSERTFIADIYDYVSVRDYNYALIPSGDYVRVRFEKNLTNQNDITVYAKSDSPAQIEVYEKDGSEVLMTFDINEDAEYKKYLTSLSGSQDTFDLLVKGSDVEFDFIVDPTSSAFCYQESANVSTSCGGLSSGVYGGDLGNNWSDGNWTTFSEAPGIQHFIGFVNYTKPANATNGSIWQTKSESGTMNLTLPQACWDNDPNKLVFAATSYPSICLNENTLIKTTNGDIPIKDVKIGDMIYSFNNLSNSIEVSEVNNVFNKSISLAGNIYYNITYEIDGTEKSILPTYNHEFYVNGDYVMAQDLNVGDVLLDFNLNNVTVKKIEIINNSEDYVWDLTVKGNHNFFANDLLVHNSLDNGFYCYYSGDWQFIGNGGTKIYEEAMIWNMTNSSGIVVSFTSPTPANNNVTDIGRFTANFSIISNNLSSAVYRFADVDYTIYNDSLLFHFGLNNLSALGENSTSFNEISINNDSASCSGTSCPVFNATGKYGGSYQFDGVNDKISIENDPIYDLNPNNKYSWSAWINPKSLNGATNWPVVMSHGDTSSNIFWIFAHTSSDPALPGTSITNGISAWWLSSGVDRLVTEAENVLSTNTWQYITVTYDGSLSQSSRFKIYLNGADVTGSSTSIGAITSISSSFTEIGHDQGFSNAFNGTIDEVSFWNRTLSLAEINELYMTNLYKLNSTQWYLIVNQTKNNTANIDNGNYSYRTFVYDKSLNYNATEQREIHVNFDLFAPQIAFSSPTPVNGANISSNSAYINVTSNDSDTNHYVITDFDNSLVAWLRFEQGNGTLFVDETGANNATCSSSGCPTFNSLGYWNGSYSFTSNNVTIPDSNNLDLVGNFTISLWARNGSSSQVFAVSKKLTDFSQATGYEFYHESAGNNIDFIGSGSNFERVTKSIDNNWHNYAVTMTSGSVVIYYDGVAQSPSIDYGGGILSAGTDRVLIGRRTPYGFYNGVMDELIIFNRSLSAQEIKAIYNATANQYYNNFTGLTTGTHPFVSYAVDKLGNKNSTGGRNISYQLGNIGECTALSTANMTYIMSNSISSSSSCINITADNITFDGRGYVLDGDDSGTDYGIYINGRNNITIKNFANINDFYYGLYVYNSTNIYLNNISYSSDDKGIYLILSRNMVVSNIISYSTASGNGLDIINSSNNNFTNISSINNYLQGIYLEGSNGNLFSVINLTYNYYGLGLQLSNNNSFVNLSSSHHAEDGVRLTFSNNNLFYNSTFSINKQGFSLDQSNFNNVSGINASSNTVADFYQSNISANDNFIIDSLFKSYSIEDLSRIYFVNSTYGEVRFFNGINGIGSNLFGTTSSDIVITNNSAYVNSAQTGINRTANITLYNIGNRGLARPAILKDGTVCRNCYNFTSLNATNVIFNVTSWSNYSIGNYSDSISPLITFVSPTPSSASTRDDISIYVNVTSNDSEGDHYVVADFDNSLVAWLRLEQGNGTLFVDETSKNNFTCSGANCPTFNSQGYWNGSYTYDGINDYISLPTTNQDLNMSMKSFSIFMWVRLNSSTTGQGAVCRYVNGGSYSGYCFGVNVGGCSGGQLGLFIANETVNGGWSCTSNTISANNWYLIGWTYDYSIKNYTIYINGTPVTSGIKASAGASAPTSAVIGDVIPAGASLNGSIDEFIVFNRSLSTQEVKSYYNATANQYYNNFTNLSYDNHTFISYAVDKYGNKNQTELRTVGVVFPLNVTSCKDLSISGATYVLQNNLTNVAGTCFNITASNVTLDGNGYTLDGTDSISTYGVFFNGVNDSKIVNFRNITDFYHGVLLDGSNRNMLINISSSSNVLYGVYISASLNNTLINVSTYSNNRGVFLATNSINNSLSLVASTLNVYGIYVSGNSNNTKITNSYASNNTNSGIYLISSSNNNLSNIITNYNSFYGINIFGEVYHSSFYNFTSNSNLRNAINIFFSSNNSFTFGAINDSRQDAIYFTDDLSLNNIFRNISITNTNSSYRDLIFSMAGSNGTQFIDMPNIKNYSFTGSGGLISVSKTGIGEIKFLGVVNGSGTNFTSDIYISNNSVYVNSSKSGLNKSANITLYGLPTNFVSPGVLRDGAVCSSCYNFTSLNAGTVIFNVSSWSNYSIGENLYSLSSCVNLNVAGATYVLQNNITYNLGTCFYVTADNIILNGGSYTLTGNNAVDYSGIYLSNVTNVTISNFKNITGFSYGTYIYSGRNNTIQNLDTSFNGAYGTYVLLSLSNNLYNLTSSRNQIGIRLELSNNTKANNVTTNNENYGLSLSNSHFNNLSNLVSNNNDIESIRISSSSSRNNLTNIIANSNAVAIVITSNSNNNIINNISLNKNSEGVTIDSYNNSISLGDINGTGFAFHLSGSSYGNTFNNISTRNSNFSDFISVDGNLNSTQFIDMPNIKNYSFTGNGGLISVSKTGIGEIKFLNNVNGSGNNFTSAIVIANNYVYVNSSLSSGGLNKSANITLYNLPTNFANPVILRDGAICADCYNFTSLNAGTVVFNVSSWSNYSIVNDSSKLTACGTLSSPNTVYTLQNSIYGQSGTCFTISADNVTLDGAGYLIDGDDISGDNGIYAVYRRNVTIKNFKNITDFGEGVYFLGSNDSVIDNLSVISNTAHGILINSKASRNTLSNLYVASSPSGGIVFDTTTSNNVINATINASAYGINLISSSNNNTFINISTRGNTYGFYLSASSNNTFINMSHTLNNYGIVVDSSRLNNFSYGIINGSINDAIYITTLPNSDNSFINISIVNNSGATNRDIFFATAGIDGTQFIDMPYIANFSFTGAGGTVVVRKTNLGEIKFLTALTGSGSNFTKDIQISSNFAYVNSSRSGLNKSANITLYNLPTNFASPVILRDGAICADCYNFTSLNAGTVIFNVSGWSNYSIGENPYSLSSCVNLTVAGMSYNLSSNISNWNGVCINIAADNVTLDGRGYSLNNNLSGFGIFSENRTNLTIKNISLIYINSSIYLKNVSFSLINSTNIIGSLNGIYIDKSRNISITNVFINNTDIYLANPSEAFGGESYDGGSQTYYYPSSLIVHHTIRVYAYKIINGITYFSEGYSESPVVTNSFIPSDNHSISWAWNPSEDADGYRVFKSDDYNGFNYDYYVDTTGPSLDDGSEGTQPFINAGSFSGNIIQNNTAIKLIDSNNLYLANDRIFKAEDSLYLNLVNNSNIYNVNITDSVLRSVTISQSQGNNFTNSSILNSMQDALYLTSVTSSNNLFENVYINGTSSLYNDLFMGTSSINGTKFIDMSNVKNYVFTGAGGLVTVKKNGLGEIKFLQPINGVGSNFAFDILVSNNSAYITYSQSGLDKFANITLYSIGNRGYSRPTILKDGSFCTNCYNFTSLNATDVVFNISGAGNYSIGNYIDIGAPKITFVSPTPANASSSHGNSIYVNVTSNDSQGDHYTFTDFDNSLVGHWRMEPGNGTATFDDTGRYNVTCLNPLSCPIFYSSGYWNGSYQLNDTSFFFTMPISASTYNFSKGFTWAAWYNGTFTTSASKRLVSISGGGGDSFIRSDNQNIACWVNNGGFISTSHGGVDTIDNTWHHVACTFTGQNLSLYVDGNIVNSTSVTGTVGFQSSNQFYFGRYPLSSAEFWNGSIDDILAFNRSLQAQEIKAIYNATANQYYNNFTNLSFSSHFVKSYAVDKYGNKNQTELRTINITNAAPNTPTLLYPTNHNVNYTRNITFFWSGSDSDGDTLQYELNISCFNEVGTTCSSKGNDDRYYTISTISTRTNYTLPVDLKYFMDDLYHYNWTVRSYDGYVYSSWSQSFQLNLSIVISVSMPVSSVDFGNINFLNDYNTSNGTPSPFVIQNDGNVKINISVNATDLWQTAVNPTPYYQFKVDNNSISNPNENLSFNWLQSITTYTNMSNITTWLLAISQLNYPDNNDSAEVDIKIRSPPSEGYGRRNSTITFYATMGE